jgi:hypothetical protein
VVLAHQGLVQAAVARVLAAGSGTTHAIGRGRQRVIKVRIGSGIGLKKVFPNAARRQQPADHSPQQLSIKK